jgi:hypothetical protein
MDDNASDAKPEVDGEKINLKVVDQVRARERVGLVIFSSIGQTALRFA